MSKTEDKFIIGESGVLKSTSKTTGLIGTYVVNKGKVSVGETWYARGYIIYKDKDGIESTTYSDIVSETM